MRPPQTREFSARSLLATVPSMSAVPTAPKPCAENPQRGRFFEEEEQQQGRRLWLKTESRTVAAHSGSGSLG